MSLTRCVRLLVVNDDEGFCSDLKQAASYGSGDSEFAVRVITEERGVVDSLSQWDPTVIVIDAHMATIDTLNLIENYLSSRVPVIVTSDAASSSIAASARRCGAVAYVPKPCHDDEMDALLATASTVAIDFGERH